MQAIQSFSIRFAVFGMLTLGSAEASILQDQTYEEIVHPHSYTATELQTIQNTQFIFADGMFGNYFKANFKPAVQLLNSWGAENEVVWGQSANDMQTNSEILYQDVLNFRRNSDKPNAILITHSKGAGEAMLMLLHHPDVAGNLGFTSFVFVSSLLGGTNIVEFINTHCNQNQNSDLCKSLEAEYPSIPAFASNVVQPMFETALANATPENKAAIESRAFYVQTQMSNDDTTSKLYVPHVWMDETHPEDGPNDGAIPTKNEIIYENGFGANAGPVFGTALGIMTGDHNSLMNRTDNAADLAYREAFFKVLVNYTLLGNPNY